MSPNEGRPNPTNARVAQRIAQVRRQRGLTLQELREGLERLGHPLLLSALSKIENGQRRVNVDDLIAMALALKVTPLTLLLPGQDAAPGEEVQLVGDSESGRRLLAELRAWERQPGPPQMPEARDLPHLDPTIFGDSDQRIHKLMADFGLREYFRTSTGGGTNTDLPREHTPAAIDWSTLPEVTSTALSVAVKDFVIAQKSSGSLLTPIDELCRLFQAAVPNSLQLLGEQDAHHEPANGSSQQMAAVFEGCIARLESDGLVKRLKFGDYVLLQPELLDAYAGAMVKAALEEPDGLGSIPEAKVIGLDVAVPSAGRVPERHQERLLVLAVLEELLERELVLREPTDDGVQLVFPSAYRHDLPTSEMPQGDGVVFRFEGPAESVYATLIVRLTRSNVFRRVATWQSAARFAAEPGTCNVSLKYDGEGKAELWIGYDRVPDQLRKRFERFVHLHLDRRALPRTVTRERHYSCPHDGTPFTSEQVGQVLRRGRSSVMCPVCENRISLRDDYEPPGGTDQSTAEMNASADAGREVAAASAVLRGKEEVAEFDVFLCHNWVDKPAVRELARQLRERGIRPWLDERQLRPGLPWQGVLEEVIASIPAAAVIVGPQGMGLWQDQELAAFIRRQCPVVPVLLPGARRADLPNFLDDFAVVDLGAAEPGTLDLLVWGITGRQPNR